MNANAEIRTKRKQSVISVPISAVASRLKGSDKTLEAQKKEKKEVTDDAMETNDNVSGDVLEEVVFVINNVGTVEKRIVTTGIQDRII